MRQVRMVVFASGWDSLGSKAEAICAGVDPNSSLDGPPVILKVLLHGGTSVDSRLTT